MKITNGFNAPKPFIWATEGSNWPPNPDRIYVTQLAMSPMVRRLLLEHYDEMENDVISYYYRILGSAIHSVIENAAKNRIGIATELSVRLPKELFGIEISGRIDWIDTIESILADIKTAGVNSASFGLKDDWVIQANVYRYMLWKTHRYLVDNLRIYPFYRDWMPTQAGNGDHPISPYGDIELPVWSIKETEDYIAERVKLHMSDKVTPCTDDERWKSPDCFAVMKRGQKKAVAATMYIDGDRKPIPTEKDAMNIIREKGLSDNEDIYVEKRVGMYRRCEGYCDCSDLCKKYHPEMWS
jgi:hypothetical protein